MLCYQYGYDDPPNKEPDGTATIKALSTLSKENTTEDLISNGMEKVEDFSDEFDPGQVLAYRDVCPYEIYFNYQKVQFKFRWNDEIPPEERGTSTYLLVFVPEDDPETENVDESVKEIEVLETITFGPESDPEKVYTVDPEEKKPGVDGAAYLLPVQIEVVDRDDPTRKWGDEKDHHFGKPTYSGDSTGDMVSWKIVGTDNWTSTTFTWTAEGPDGESITGPTGAGKNAWTINDDDDDTETDWLNWKPGKWTINVEIGSTQAEFEQEVGWRTEDYVVIGQIVPTDTHDDDAPPLLAVGDNFWEISSPVSMYRRAVLYDILDLPLFDNLADGVRDTLMITPLPITEKLTEAWFGYWFIQSSSPKGPFTSAHPSGNGSVEYGHRFWAMQHVFNVSPDNPAAPESFASNEFATHKDAKQYRIIQRYKSKFLVTEDGKVDSENIALIHQVAEAGPTKMNFGIAEGEFESVWDNPPYTFFSLPTQPSETNHHQGAHTVAQDGTKLSFFVTGRVGPGGQNVNWRLMGKDAPWIFAEVIIELKANGTIEQSYKTSIDVTWTESAGQDGERPFNNMNFYMLKRNLQTDEYEFQRQELLEMEGSLEAFIDSASGQKPEPPIPPSVE